MVKHPKPLPTQEREHALITSNLIRFFENAFLDKPCYVYTSQMRVRGATSAFYANPDVTLVCGERQWEDESHTTLLNPTAIIEVITDATERADRGDKFHKYLDIPSLREYVLVPYDLVWILQFVRRPGGIWGVPSYDKLDEELKISAVGCSVPLREIYHMTELMDGDTAQTVHND